MRFHQRLFEAGLGRLPRPVWLEIDLEALTENVAAFREVLGAAPELSAVVKADAYGHGLIDVARAFEKAGVNRLCVASLDEAFALRAAGLRLAILVLFPVPLGALNFPEATDVEITLSTTSAISSIQNLVIRDREPPLAVHVEVETGLGRGGVKPELVPRAVATLDARRDTYAAGIWTHIATPESAEATARQIAEFDRAAALVREAGLRVPPRHVAATGGLLTGRAPAYEGVRIGLGLYGLLPLDLPIPDTLLPLVHRLRPAMQLKCQPLRVEKFPTGTPIGYGGTWVTARESAIATLPVGYGDGWARAYTPGAEALVQGRRVPLVGTVAMDAVMADVTDIDGVTTEDEFVLLGNQGAESITAADLARARNTIPWEVVTSMSFRVPRVYHAASVLMGLRTLTGELAARAEAVG